MPTEKKPLKEFGEAQTSFKLALEKYPILRHFQYQQLPLHLQAISAPICNMALHMAKTLPQSAETAAGLRKLLEAKDCLVRAEIERG